MMSAHASTRSGEHHRDRKEGCLDDLNARERTAPQRPLEHDPRGNVERIEPQAERNHGGQVTREPEGRRAGREA
jgi:hypothetical protein